MIYRRRGWTLQLCRANTNDYAAIFENEEMQFCVTITRKTKDEVVAALQNIEKLCFAALCDISGFDKTGEKDV
jgi:hypothetical protein